MMEFSRELLFFFSALGAFNGLVLSIYFLLVAKPRTKSNYFLGILLLTLSIRIGKSVFLYFNPYLAGVFLQFGMSACVFIGPSLYFYLKSVLHPEDRTSTWLLHFLPLLVATLVIDILYPWDSFPHIWSKLFFGIYGIWLIYLLLSGWKIRSILKKLFSKNAMTSMEVWLASVYIGNLLIWIAYNTVSYTSYILGALSFSFVFYLLILVLIFTRKKDPGFLSRQAKYGNKVIDEEEATKLYLALQELMESAERFKDADLKLSQLAEEMHLLPHRLSQFLNDNLGKSFTLFVNEYRVKHAQKLIVEKPHLKLESIGYECGFNSKSTFYTAFKKIAGVTPAQFKEQAE